MNDVAKLTLTDHLEELRSRIIKSVLVLAFFMLAAFFFLDTFLILLIKPVGKLVFIAPQEAFVANIKVAFFGGLSLSIPFILYQIWKFVFSALNTNERQLLYICGPLSLVLFYSGAFFCYFVIIPISLNFLLGFSSTVIEPAISISKYISFVGSLVLVFGVIFELPLITFFVTKIGLVTPRTLVKGRRYAIVVIFMLAAILTPPDVVTQCLLAFPLIILYEVGIIFSKMTYKHDD